MKRIHYWGRLFVGSNPGPLSSSRPIKAEELARRRIFCGLTFSLYLSLSLIKTCLNYFACIWCQEEERREVCCAQRAVRSDIRAVGLYVSSCLFSVSLFVFLFCPFFGWEEMLRNLALSSDARSVLFFVLAWTIFLLC